MVYICNMNSSGGKDGSNYCPYSLPIFQGFFLKKDFSENPVHLDMGTFLPK